MDRAHAHLTVSPGFPTIDITVTTTLLCFLLFIAKHNPDTVPSSGLEIGNQRFKRQWPTYYSFAAHTLLQKYT